jgi:hypothetical protein
MPPIEVIDRSGTDCRLRGRQKCGQTDMSALVEAYLCVRPCTCTAFTNVIGIRPHHMIRAILTWLWLMVLSFLK